MWVLTRLDDIPVVDIAVIPDCYDNDLFSTAIELITDDILYSKKDIPGFSLAFEFSEEKYGWNIRVFTTLKSVDIIYHLNLIESVHIIRGN